MDIGIDFTQEGGSSLAIYMNGVAQEMLHLVRATAPSPVDQSKPYHKTVTGAEAVYRRAETWSARSKQR